MIRINATKSSLLRMSGARKAFSIDSSMAQAPFSGSEPDGSSGVASDAPDLGGILGLVGLVRPCRRRPLVGREREPAVAESRTRPRHPASASLGNSSTWAVPPADSIFAVALLLNASATTKRGRVTSPWPRTLSGLSSDRTSPTAARMSGVIVTGAGLPARAGALAVSAWPPARARRGCPSRPGR